MPAPETPWSGQWKDEMENVESPVLAGFVTATAILVFVGWLSCRDTGRFL
jgi:hypothetical protein